MNDLELAEEIARGDLVIAAANPQHRYVPLEIKDQIIAALRRENEAQARIAELEKVLRLYQRGRHGWEEEGMLAGEWLKIQAQFDAAVTEALKDRA